MPVSLTLASSLFAFSLFSMVSIKNADPAFTPSVLNGKRITCVDSSVTSNAWLTGGAGISSSLGLYSSILPDLDGIYARKVFDSTYVPVTTYTGPLLDAACDVIVKKHEATRVSTTDSADYAVVLRVIKLNQRVNLQTVLSIDAVPTGKSVAHIRVDAKDKFSLGGKSRFQKGFENLKSETIKNLEKDYDPNASKNADDASSE